MNLEDYAYEDNGRWYVNPQVSLDEQNAFIDNYRNVEAANNAQIAAQTRALGTQVPSQLGGLTGAGSYFRSRYQTPQTNQTIADLRAAAQAAALQSALNNEIAKYKKLYRDSQNAGTGGGNGGLNALDVETVDTNAGDEQKLKERETEKQYYDSGSDWPGAAAGAVVGAGAGALPVYAVAPWSSLLAPILGGAYGYDVGKKWWNTGKIDFTPWN